VSRDSSIGTKAVTRTERRRTGNLNTRGHES
jgi:hypothetical protein